MTKLALVAFIALVLGSATVTGSAQSPSSPTQRGARQPATASAPASAPKGPIRVEPAKIDFGFVQPHTLLETTAKIVNDTDQPRTIVKAIPTCQCTTVELDGKVIPAKGELSFPLSMKVSSTGLKLAGIQIVIEGMDSVLQVDMRAEVVYSVRAVTQNSPGGAWDPYIDADTNPERVRGEVTVGTLDRTPFRVLSVGGRPPQFLGWDASQPPRASYRVKYDVSARDCDSMPRYLIIETDRPDAPLIDMRVRHKCTHIRPQVSFAEFRANAGVISPGHPGVFEIEVKNAATPAGPIRVTGVTSTRPELKARLVNQTFDGKSVLLTVELTPTGSASGVMLFPVRFDVTVPQKAPFTEDFLVYCKLAPDA